MGIEFGGVRYVAGLGQSDGSVAPANVDLGVAGGGTVPVFRSSLLTTLYAGYYGDFQMFESDANFRADMGYSGGSIPYSLRDMLYVRGPRIAQGEESIYPGMIVRAGKQFSTGNPTGTEHVFEGPTGLRLGAYAPSTVSGSAANAKFAASIASGVEGKYIRFQWSNYTWEDVTITGGVAEATISITALFSTVASGNPIGINYMTYRVLDANKNPTGDQVTLQWEGVE